MFRRFMIVCWGLFLVLVLSIAISWFVAFESKHERNLANSELLELEQDPLHTTAQDMRPRLTARELMPPQTGNSVDDDLTELEVEAKEHLDKESEVRKRIIKSGQRMFRWSAVAVWVFWGAAIVLVWNIIWHVGHWVWMGRHST